MKIFHIILFHHFGITEKISAISRGESEILLRAAALCVESGAETFEVRTRSNLRTVQDSILLANFGLL